MRSIPTAAGRVESGGRAVDVGQEENGERCINGVDDTDRNA